MRRISLTTSNGSTENLKNAASERDERHFLSPHDLTANKAENCVCLCLSMCLRVSFDFGVFSQEGK